MHVLILCLVRKESSPGTPTLKTKGPIPLPQSAPLGPSRLTVIRFALPFFLHKFLTVVNPTGRPRVIRQVELLFAYITSTEVISLKIVLIPTSLSENLALCPPNRH